MPSKRELYAGLLFFAMAAVAVAAFRRPFDLVGWACLAVCLCFMVLAGVALLKPRDAAKRTTAAPLVRGGSPPAVDAEGAADVEMDDEPVGEPSAGDIDILDETIRALEAVGALDAGEVDARSLWMALQRLDPGRTLGIYEALGSFSALHDEGRTRIGRLTFVPSHTEYDAPLLAEITGSLLTSLGHAVEPKDVTVILPPGGGQGVARISFPIEGRTETIGCAYLWKYPPADLFPELARFARGKDPRDLVGADCGDQTLLFAAIRSGTRAELNRRLPAGDEMFFDA